MVLVATCGFGGCGYTEIAVFPDMAGVVRDGLRLVCFDRHFVCYSILAGVAHGVRAGGESSVKPEIGLRSALNGRGVCRIVFELRSNIVAGVLYQRPVVHPQAVAGGPIEVQARAVVVAGGARRRGFSSTKLVSPSVPGSCSFCLFAVSSLAQPVKNSRLAMASSDKIFVFILSVLFNLFVKCPIAQERLRPRQTNLAWRLGRLRHPRPCCVRRCWGMKFPLNSLSPQVPAGTPERDRVSLVFFLSSFYELN